MNYLEAKSQLQKKPPKLSFRLMAIEAVVLLLVADFLVSVFAV